MEETYDPFSHVVVLAIPIMGAADPEAAVAKALEFIKAEYRKAIYHVDDRKTGERHRVDASQLVKR